MLVKTINRSALLAWSPKNEKIPMVACGTTSIFEENKYSENSKLEIFDVSQEQPVEMLSISVPSSFNRILWTSIEANSKNLLVGAFVDGRIELYDVNMLLNAESNAVLEVPILHSGSVKGLCVSAFQPNLIATGATDAEIALWDLDNIRKSSLINVKKTEKFGNTSNLAWNPRVAHIIAAASDSGVVSIIDLRSKKEVVNFNLPDYASVSSIAWNPDIATSIVASSNDDDNPFAYLWDLRAASSPKNIFKGHSKGISSLSWCQNDTKMMLSTGKDGKSLCWDPEYNRIIREYKNEEEGLDIKFCPSNPNVFSVSHRNFIEFRSINGDESSEENFYHKSCDESPKWLNCPVGSSFGGNNICSTFRPNTSNICLIKPKIDFFSWLSEDLMQFEKMINEGLIEKLCDKHILKQPQKEELLVWELLKRFESSNFGSEVFKLAENSRNSFNSNLFAPENIENRIKNFNFNNSAELNDFDYIITDKIIESDFEGAMHDCLNSSRYFNALIIANCGGKELRTKAEQLILKDTNSFHVNLAIRLMQNDLEGFITTVPVGEEWFRLIKVIFKHATAEYAPNLFKVLSKRLIRESMNIPALLAASLARDFETFLEIVFSRTPKDGNLSVTELIYYFKIIRIIEALEPNTIKSLKNYSNKVMIFEIVSKLISLFISSGLRIDSIMNFIDREFYDTNIKTKNPEIDAFFEGINQPSYNYFESIQQVTESPGVGKLNSPTHQTTTSSAVLTNSPSKPRHFFEVKSPSSMSSNTNYNDAPMINPKLAKLSPQFCIQEIKPEDVLLALKSLSDTISSKTMIISEPNRRIVQECFKKLTPESICSKDYSNLSKACIFSLFKELSLSNYDLSSTLAANILASFFSETKEWILPLKRLIEVAKN